MRISFKFFLSLSFLFGLISSLYAGNDLENMQALPSAVVEIKRSDVSPRLTVTVPEIGRLESQTIGGEAVIRAALDMEPATARPGWPELPMVSRMVLVPPTGGIEVQINDISFYIETDYNPFIVAEQDGSADVDLSGSPSDDYLAINGFWPPSPVEISQPAILRGHRLVQVIFYPMQVNRVTGEVRYNTWVDFELVSAGEGVNELVNPLRPRPSSTINRVLESLVVNPPAPSRDDPQRGSYLLVYYSANGIANSLAPLVNWRKRQGWVVNTMAFQPGTSLSDIKTQIQRAYNDWEIPPEMVALVGDPDWANNGIPANAGSFTDLDYARLDGNDILADVDYGRITCRTIQELDRVVGKIVNYESDPFMDNTNWYRQGAVCAGNAISGLSTILVSRWVRKETLARGWDNVHEWYFNAPFEGQSVSGFFQSELSRGVNFVTYRGWIGMEGLSADGINGFQATRRYPFATVMTCQSGHYVTAFCQSEGFFISAGGAIGAIGFATSSTHVQYNNAVFTGIWHGLLKLGMTNLGTACNYGRYEVFRQYAGFEDQRVTEFCQWANLMGDPATDMFTAVPQIVTAEFDEEVALGATRIPVRILDQNGENSVPGVQVCLFKADDELQLVSYTDENGVAEFALASDALTEGDLLVTATGHNLKPILETIAVGQADQFIGAESWEIQDNENGNGDGIPNPGETIALHITIRNFGTGEPEGGITISFESLTTWAQVDGNAIDLDAAPSHGETVVVSVPVQIDPSAPNETAIPVAVNVRNGETVWRSLAAVQVNSPHIEIEAAFIANNRLEPGGQADIDFSLKNSGAIASSPIIARLWSETDVVTVITEEAGYPAIDPGRSSRSEGNDFRLRAHPFAIPGMKATLRLAIETELGFRDTTTYILTVGAPRVTDPFGPDKYGYVCFDSGDRDWEMAPVYDWIEIDPQANDRDFNGTVLNLQDGGEDNDRSMAIDLPFEFQYYGEVFNRATICTNGWLAFGNQAELADFRNRRINSGGGPNGQLCVFWDDLQTGRIVTYYDEDNGRFIVEWNNMRSQADNSTEIFQLILFDTRIEPTYSGDGVILFQYKNVRNPAGVGPSNDTPFATIGINSPSDLDGLEYTYYNTYTPGAQALQNELAIKFTTAIQYITGVLAVQVTDAWTGAPISGAEVNTARGFWGECDDEGNTYINDILIDDYEWLDVSAQGYNDSTWAGDENEGFSIHEAETLWVSIPLLHPEFYIDRDEFTFMMLVDSTVQTGFMLSNTGNGTLQFESRYTYVIDDDRASTNSGEGGPVRDDPDDLWDELLSWNATTPVENTRLQGVAFVGDRWIVSGGHIANREDTLNYFYEFTKNGEYTGNRYPQTTANLYGYRDMEYFEGLLYCAFDPISKIVAIDPYDFSVVGEWALPRGFNNARNVTIDPATGHIWASGATTRLYEMEIQNDSILVEIRNFQTVFPGTPDQIHEYGLSWFRDDPDGFNLYMIATDESGTDPNAPSDNTHANVALFKMNPNTGDIRYLTDFVDLDPATQARGGITITPKWNNLVWGLAVLYDHPEGDIVTVYELAPNSSWIDYSPRSDTLLASEFVPIELTIATADLDTGSYGVIIEFLHNADDGVTQVPVSLDVVTELDIVSTEERAFPLEYSLSQNYPNPFNAVTRIDFTLKERGDVRLELFDIQGRSIRTIIDGNRLAGVHRITLDGAELPTGLYFYRLEAGSFKASRKLIIAK